MLKFPIWGQIPQKWEPCLLAENTVLKVFGKQRKTEFDVKALENRVWREIFHCIEYIFYHPGFLSNLRLP